MRFHIKKPAVKPCLIINESTITEVNEAFTFLSGFTSEELIGKSLQEFSSMIRIGSQIDLNDMHEAHSCYMFTKELNAREVNISCVTNEDNHQRKYFFVENRIYRLEDNLPYLLSIFSKDTTGIGVYSLPDGILLRANKNFISNWNPAMHDSIDNLLGRSLGEIYENYSGSRYESIFRQVMETGTPFHCSGTKYTHKTKNDTYWDVSLIPIFVGGKPKYVIHTSLDVTASVNIQLNIKAQNSALEAIIENMSDGLAFVDKNLKVTLLNDAARDFYYNPEIAENNPYSVPEDMECFDMNGNLLQGEQLIPLRVLKGERVAANRIKVSRPDGVFYYSVSGMPIYDNDGNIEKALICIRNIQNDVINAELEQTIKLLDEIFTNVSHELKTPLNVIFSTNQLIEMYIKNGYLNENKDKLIRSTSVIKQNCYRFTKLINNIVDLSKIDSGFYNLILSNENIVSIVENIVLSVVEYVEQNKLHIIFDTDVEEKIIACEPDKIERIILNLISNAIKFTNPGGQIYVSILDKNDSVEISVRDTGIGIDKKYLSTIFKRFQQVDRSLARNAEGTGIGLSLVESLVELHGGTVNVKSEIGQGSTFTVVLPSKLVASTEKPEEMEHHQISQNKFEMINIEFSDIYTS